jgi:hypothetical protein
MNYVNLKKNISICGFQAAESGGYMQPGDGDVSKRPSLCATVSEAPLFPRRHCFRGATVSEAPLANMEKQTDVSYLD